MIQQVIVIALFLIAGIYMGTRIWKAFDKRDNAGCAKGCGCATDKADRVAIK